MKKVRASRRDTQPLLLPSHVHSPPPPFHRCSPPSFGRHSDALHRD
jgi:hypothetical protein